MKKLLFLIFFMLPGAVSLVSAQDLRSVFRDAPDEIFPLLTKNLRADLVDFADAGMTAKVTNNLDGVSVLEKLEDNYLLLATTASSTMQLKLLPMQNGAVICVVKTVKAEAADSRIRFYDLEWNRLDEHDMFVAPAIRDFFIPDADVEEVADMCDIYLVTLTLDTLENTLVAEYTMPAYMSTDDAVKVNPLLRKLVYKWNGERFINE